jgi:hypothetical protein
MNASPVLKQQFYNSVQPLSTQAHALRSEIKKAHYGLGGAFVWTSLGVFLAEASSLRARVSAETAKINVALNDFLERINAIDRDLKIAERTMELFSSASFPLKPNESPVLAVEGKAVDKDKCDGTLYSPIKGLFSRGGRRSSLKRSFS